MKLRLFRSLALALGLLLAAMWGSAAALWHLYPDLRQDPLGTLTGLCLVTLAMALLVGHRMADRMEVREEQHLRAGLRGLISPGQDTLLAVALDTAHDLEFQRDQQAQNAAELQRVLESLDTAVIAADGMRRVLYANSAAARMFHLGELPARGKRLTTLPRIPQLLAWAEEAIAAQEPVAGRIQLPDDRTLQAYVTPFECRPPGFVVLARDITDTIHLETSRRDFIAGVSHELRTPLTSILGYAELLKDNETVPREMRHQFLDTILSNTTRLTRLAQDLVTLSSVETGTYPFHFEEVEASGLVGPAVKVLQPLADDRGCQIDVGGFDSGRVRVDPDAFHRVLLNLIENAIVHGGKPVEVHLEGERHGEEYEISIRDNGVGIGTMDQPRIFERFYRVDKSHSRLGGGSGLGLALVKHIVREHGGQIELHSALGKGTTFRIRLPLCREPAASTSGVREAQRI